METIIIGQLGLYSILDHNIDFCISNGRREAPFRCRSNVETPSIVTPSLRTTARSVSAMSTPSLNTGTQDMVTQIMSTPSLNTGTQDMVTQIMSTPSMNTQILSTPSVSTQNVNQHTNYADKNSFQIAILVVSVFLYAVVVV